MKKDKNILSVGSVNDIELELNGDIVEEITGAKFETEKGIKIPRLNYNTFTPEEGAKLAIYVGATHRDYLVEQDGEPQKTVTPIFMWVDAHWKSKSEGAYVDKEGKEHTYHHELRAGDLFTFGGYANNVSSIWRAVIWGRLRVGSFVSVQTLPPKKVGKGTLKHNYSIEKQTSQQTALKLAIQLSGTASVIKMYDGVIKFGASLLSAYDVETKKRAINPSAMETFKSSAERAGSFQGTFRTSDGLLDIWKYDEEMREFNFSVSEEKMRNLVEAYPEVDEYAGIPKLSSNT